MDTLTYSQIIIDAAQKTFLAGYNRFASLGVKHKTFDVVLAETAAAAAGQIDQGDLTRLAGLGVLWIA